MQMQLMCKVYVELAMYICAAYMVWGVHMHIIDELPESKIDFARENFYRHF